MSKGVMGPLASGVATVALIVGYVAGWPADALAILAAIAGGGNLSYQPDYSGGISIPSGSIDAPTGLHLVERDIGTAETGDYYGIESRPDQSSRTEVEALAASANH